jgi:hypothetical protein
MRFKCLRRLDVAIRACAAVLLILLTTACTRGRVANAESSPEALAVAVLNAIHHRDTDRLRQLALNEEEFRDVVWPELPAARPERNVPFGYAWTDLRSKSEAALAGTLQRHGETPLEFVGIRFTGGMTQYRTYVVRRDAALLVRDPAGHEEEIRVFGAMFEQNGQFKVFSYVID